MPILATLKTGAKRKAGAVSWVTLLSRWISRKSVCWLGLPVQGAAVLMLCPFLVFKLIVNQICREIFVMGVPEVPASDVSPSPAAACGDGSLLLICCVLSTDCGCYTDNLS